MPKTPDDRPAESPQVEPPEVVVDPSGVPIGLRAGVRCVALPLEVAALLAPLLRSGAAAPPPTPAPKQRLATDLAKGLAMALRLYHPGWTHRQVADAIGYSVRQLYRWPEYMRLAALTRAKEHVRRGSKDARTGRVETADDVDD